MKNKIIYIALIIIKYFIYISIYKLMLPYEFFSLNDTFLTEKFKVC